MRAASRNNPLSAVGFPVLHFSFSLDLASFSMSISSKGGLIKRFRLDPSIGDGSVLGNLSWIWFLDR